MNNFTIKRGDSYKLIKEIPENSIDLILTDPPYNLNSYSTGDIHCNWRKTINNKIAKWDEKDLDIENLLKEYKRVLNPTGNIFIFTTYNLMGSFHKLFDPEFDTFQIMVWHKTNPPPKIRRAGFLNSCELIMCCWNKGHTWNFTKQSEMHNFFESPICMGKERLNHPTQKPVKLLKHIINIASNAGDVILDNFMGVGSTGVAALELGRQFLGFEIDNVYFKQAKDRLKNIK